MDKSIASKEDYEEDILQYREKAYEYLNEIDEYIKKKDMESIVTFVRFFEDKEFRRTYMSSIEQLAYAYILAVITANELSSGVRPLFVSNGDSVAELKHLLKRIEFLLWEIEFQVAPDAEALLNAILEEYQVSAEVLKNVITVAGIEKKGCYMTLACLYIENNKTQEAIKLLDYGVAKYPEDENLLRILVQLCKKVGDYIRAEQYEEKLKCIKQ